MLMCRCSVIALISCLLAGGSYTAGAGLFVDVFKFSDPAYETGIEVDLSGVTGVTAVRAVSAGGTTLTFDVLGTEMYAARLGPFGTFANIQNGTVGGWRLLIDFAGGTAVYDFTVHAYRSPFEDASFPPAPTMIDPVDGQAGVSQTPTFLWDNGGLHDGPIESLFVSVWSLTSPGVGAFEDSFGGPILLNDESWICPIVLPPGVAAFLVQYETNLDEDPNVDEPLYNQALSSITDPGIVWDAHSGDLFSRDLVEFTVVPEPSAALALLAGLAAIAGQDRRRD